MKAEFLNSKTTPKKAIPAEQFIDIVGMNNYFTELTNKVKQLTWEKEQLLDKSIKLEKQILAMEKKPKSEVLNMRDTNVNKENRENVNFQNGASVL